MVQKIKNKLTFRPVWTFPEDVENHLEQLLDYAFEFKDNGRVLHAPCGISKLGKKSKLFENKKYTITNLDFDPKVKPDIIGDIYNLKDSVDGLYDIVISDPVWLKVDTCPNCKEVEFSSEKGIAYPLRRRLSYSVRDILKPGGLWFFNGLWNPEVKGLELAPFPGHIHDIEMVKQNYNSFRNLSLIMCLKKVNQKIV